MFHLGPGVWLDGDLSTVVGLGTTFLRGQEIPRVLVRCTMPDGTGRRHFTLEGNQLYHLEVA